MNLSLTVRAVMATTLMATAAGCGTSDGDATDATTATSPPASVTQAESAPAQPSSPDAQAARLPQDPCKVLTTDQVGTVLVDPGTGRGASGGDGPGSAAACEWEDAQQKTFLEFLVFDLGADDPSQLTAEMLLQMRGGADSALRVLDFAPAAIGGAEEGDAVIQWIGPGGLYQLRMYSVGDAADPGAQWSALQQPLQDLALAVSNAAK